MTNLATLYERMLTIRLVEERLQGLCDEGLAGDLHFNRGQEAIAVGACAALGPDDRMVTHHRTIAHQIARGAPLRPLIAELLGRSTGVRGGRAGEMHISDPSIGHDFSFQLVGTCIPVAAGLAWARRQQGKPGVVAVFFGDAATANGQFHEGLNIAVIHGLPLLLICEDNGRAGNITSEYYQPDGRAVGVERRAAGYGISSTWIDGNDVEAMQDAVEDVVESMAASPGPFMLVCETERLCCHKQGQRDVRSKEELERLAMREPIRIAEEALVRDGLDVGEVRARLTATVSAAFSLALADPYPEVLP